MTAPQATASIARRAAALDAALVAPGPAWKAHWVHASLAAVIGLRLATRDWTVLADRPPELRTHTNLLAWVPDLPSGALVALQLIGIVAALAAVARWRPRLAFTVAWASYIVLCGLWSSWGKVMHNDVLTATVAAVWLFASPPGRDVRGGDVAVRWGWPPRASLVVLTTVYFLTGAQKLRHSGLAWALGENMAWVLREGAHGSPFGAAFPQAVADLPLLPQLLASGALLLELTAPLWLLAHRGRIPFALAVAAMHGSIWACLGLDYSAWVLTAAAVAVPLGLPGWQRLPARRRPPAWRRPAAAPAP
jgi:hypothetical protein